jgi:ATP-dependent DNA helicase DinG
MQTTTRLAPPDSPQWGSPPLPEWVTGFRSHQEDALREIQQHYDNGIDVVLVDAPTGSGKSLIGEIARRAANHPHALYVCHTKSLQDQFLRDYPYARVLKGRSNYPTLDEPHAWLTAADCTMADERLPACSKCPQMAGVVSEETHPHCVFCHPWSSCPYKAAKERALDAPVAVLNTSYFLTEANGPGFFSGFPFAIMDECDTLESILLSYIEVKITHARMKELKIEPPKYKTVSDNEEETWTQWVATIAIPAVKQKITSFGKPTSSEPKEKRRKRAEWINLAGKLQRMALVLAQGNAIYDGYADGDVIFRPVTVDQYGPDLLWKHADKWLLMTATLIEPHSYVESLGIEEAGLSWAYVQVPSTFPKENRPIYCSGVTSMSKKNQDVGWPAMVTGIDNILAARPGERVLVHTVSYPLAEYLARELQSCFPPREIFTYTNAQERDATLASFLLSDSGVLLAPSMDRGIDLAGDACRVVIVAKVPFPYLGDKRVNQRLYGTAGGQLWYNVQTIRTLVQMTGRAVRSADDFCETWILDSEFRQQLWGKAAVLMPEWWKEALRWDG